MNYEQEYKKAFEAAKGLHDAGNALTKKQMEIVFPQLAESEDERIRKALINYFKAHSDLVGENWNGIECDDVIAYLEKQKINTEGDFGRGYDCGYEACLNSHGAEWFEKQKEQKQILEVFGFKVGDAVKLKDGDGRKHIIKSFEEVEGLHGPNFYHVEFEDNSARSGIYTGEEYPNGYYTQMEKFEEEQKPAEYLDKDMVYSIMKKLHDLAFSQLIPIDSEEYKKIGEITSEVRSLLDYPIEQKPAGWSEEDRLHYTNVLEALEYVKGCKSDYDKIEAVKSDIAWLKLLRNRVGKDSLQPHWKPSEEQMKAFKGYIEDFQARAEAAVGGWNNFDVMIRLYEQLKKL